LSQILSSFPNAIVMFWQNYRYVTNPVDFSLIVYGLLYTLANLGTQ
jgi:hypothetical protein